MIFSFKNNRFVHLFVRWSIFVVFVTLIALMFPSSVSVESEYTVGAIWTDNDFYAPFSFPIYKDKQEYQHEREIASSKVYPVFEEQNTIAKTSLNSLRKFFSQVSSLFADTTQSSAENIFPINFQENEWKILESLWKAPEKNYSFKKLQRDILLVVNGLYLQGILDISKSNFPKNQQIAVRKKSVEQITPIEKYLDKQEIGKTIEQTFIKEYKKDNDTIALAVKIAAAFTTPNILYQQEQTEKEKFYAMDLVPRTIGTVQENERIIGKDERITESTKQKLNSLRQAKIEQGADINRFTIFIGKLLYVAIISLLGILFLYAFRKRILLNNKKIFLIAGFSLLEIFLAYSITQSSLEASAKFLLVVPMVSMLFTIIFDSRVALYSTLIIALLIAGVCGNDYALAISSLIAGTFAVYTVRDIKKRTQIFRSIAYIFLGYVISIIAIGLERYETISTVLNQILFAGANAIVSPLLAYAILIFLEKTFRIVTDLTLMELADFNHPLLKELSHKAPGTFHHSISVGTLAETAAESIKANSALAKVGAYYHDVGKMLHPSMFIENQLENENNYEHFNTKKSVEIIFSHIQDGIALGKKYKLPDVVLNFIPTHHGTTVMKYFYEQALQSKNENDAIDNVIDENDFRYPGPKPNSKETGIVMLADAVEASTRTIEEPTLQKIEENIDTIVKERLVEGQLDECNLTMKELKTIKESFAKILVGVHHTRIKYPEQKLEEKELEEVVKPKRRRTRKKKESE